jgi:hypothetical protein
MAWRTWLAGTCLALAVTACGSAAPAPHAHPPSHTGAATTTAPAANTSPVQGTVTGTFTRAGGPLGADGAQPPTIPLRGTVSFVAGRQHTFAVAVGKTGLFSVQLPPGHYVVSGRSPSILGMSPTGAIVESTCSPSFPVTIVAGRTVHVSVVCPVP